MSEKPRQLRGAAAREKLVGIASGLFYENGVRAVGIDEVVRRSGMAKASLYRWFPSKDDLVLAVLQRRDDAFWSAWDDIAARHPEPRDELDAQLSWMQDLAAQENYRGCAFVNTAAEYEGSPSSVRDRCLAHEEELRRRLRALTARLGRTGSDQLADQLHLAIVGAFATGGLYAGSGPAGQLTSLADVLLGSRGPTGA
ncbi:TetR/AcrR family transcriptional regulator [Streptomyces sp. NA04227]|uniref:TetR/AcrR family transcriptional regulator n=1 Tax=Streptomyces sp. NA04227 TaxID=2742136 RepID=UPI00158FC4EA|nr:TetR/AcrR family transcriptional regulator [Streptomyces sp. NA04227]QKW05414.1 TetR/AcrR family transcriptional regulator [Streptomyces sp. NA04227]